MDLNQQQVAIHHASLEADDELVIDAQVGDPSGFDPVDDGVWIKAWVWVPKEAIPGYQAPLPAPASEVVTTNLTLMTYNEFEAAYRAAYRTGGEEVSQEQVSASWESYVRDPAGHFISKSNQ